MPTKTKTTQPTALLPTTKRKRFSVFHLYLGELSCKQQQRAEEVLSRLVSSHPKVARNWPDRDHFAKAVTDFLNTSRPGEHMMIGSLGAIVRAK